MSADAGLSQQYTNHSLRAFGATKMFQEGLPEKLVQERTGHRSAESLRQYQRTSEEQKIMSSHSMNGTLADNLKLQPTSHPATQQLLPCTSSAIQPAAQQIFSYHPSTRKESSFVGCSFQGCSITINIVQQPPTTEDHLQGIDPSTRKESSFVGCSFQGCSITINIVQQPPTTEDHLQGIDINDLFGDL